MRFGAAETGRAAGFGAARRADVLLALLFALLFALPFALLFALPRLAVARFVDRLLARFAARFGDFFFDDFDFLDEDFFFDPFLEEDLLVAAIRFLLFSNGQRTLRGNRVA